MDVVKDEAERVPVTSAVGALVVFVAMLSAFLAKAMTPTLGLIVANTTGTRFFIWNLVTAAFYETSLLRALPGAAAIVWAGREVEPRFGPWYYFAGYVFLCALACGVITSVGLFVAYVLTREDELLFRVTHGTAGLIGALAVALKRFVPEQPIHGALPAITGELLPMGVIALAGALWALGALGLARAPTDALYAPIGVYVGWFYLRYVHPAADGSAGDVSEGFAFETLFPRPARRFVAGCGNFCYGVAVLCGYHQHRAASGPPGSLSSAASGLSAVGSVGSVFTTAPGGSSGEMTADPVAERRRNKALAVLDARLAAMEQQKDDTWLDDSSGAPVAASATGST